MVDPKKEKKSALIALAGLPNAGKSTLTNKLLGHKLSIVSHHPHTTRRRALGIYYENNAQLALFDTPGLAKNTPDTLDRAMQAQLVESLEEADLLVWMLRVDGDITPPKKLLQLLQKPSIKARIILVLNQIDRLAKGTLLLPLLRSIDQTWSSSNYLELIPISAKRGTSVERLTAALAKHAPRPYWLFEEGFHNDQPELFYLAELIREKLLWQTRAEVPHQIGVSIERLEITDTLVHIDAVIQVEKPGQKMIIIGQGGRALKNAGSKVRSELENYFTRKVMLKLFVQVRPGWRQNSTRISEYFYSR